MSAQLLRAPTAAPGNAPTPPAAAPAKAPAAALQAVVSKAVSQSLKVPVPVEDSRQSSTALIRSQPAPNRLAAPPEARNSGIDLARSFRPSAQPTAGAIWMGTCTHWLLRHT